MIAVSITNKDHKPIPINLSLSLPLVIIAIPRSIPTIQTMPIDQRFGYE